MHINKGELIKEKNRWFITSHFVQVSGKFLSSQRTKNMFKIDLTLNQNVIITEAYIPEFSVSSFFASLGGALGLWLGVGAVQLCGSGISLAAWVRSNKY